jgi:hypothetical protein
MMRHDQGPGHGHGSGHEKTDVSMRVVVWTAVGYVGLGVLALVICWFFFFGLRPARLGEQRSLRHDRPAAPLPPEPRLQVAPWTDMQAQKAYEDNLLHTYGWADRPTGRARIPIERAIEIVAERGAP